ncbi:hypothetical protein [Methanobrevibacter arboriphilus]|nr:hypothetical protein [Methanobrevibacter arboriphilus]
MYTAITTHHITKTKNNKHRNILPRCLSGGIQQATTKKNTTTPQ